MGDDLCAGLDVERGHLRQPFFHAGDDFAPRKMGTDATMRSIRKGVMRIGAAREKDFIGVLELPRISRRKYGRTRYVVPLLDQYSSQFDIARCITIGVDNGVGAKELL